MARKNLEQCLTRILGAQGMLAACCDFDRSATDQLLFQRFHLTAHRRISICLLVCHPLSKLSLLRCESSLPTAGDPRCIGCALASKPPSVASGLQTQQMQQVTSVLHNQLQQHGVDTSELLSNLDAIHFVTRVIHQDGKIRLLALLSILHALIHRTPAIVLFPSTEAQQHFRQTAETLSFEAQQSATASASAQESAAAAAALLHQEQVNFIQGCPVTVIHPQSSHPTTLSSTQDVPLINDQHQTHAQSHAGKVVLCILDHDLCTSDAQLQKFWGHLRRCKQQQQQQQQQQQHQTGIAGQQLYKAGHSVASLLSTTFGYVGSLWRIVSMTISLPGLASTLTGTSEPGFSTHFLQTVLPKGCTAHPLMLPQQQGMHGVQRRVTPSLATPSQLQAQDKHGGSERITWYSLYPGVLQWLACLAESAASSTHSADAKLIKVVGNSHASCTDRIVSHAQASGLSLVALELDSRAKFGGAQVQSMLTATPDCFPHFVEALHPSMILPLDKASLLDGCQKGGSAAKLALHPESTSLQKTTAVLQASASAGLAQHKVIHGIVFLSWETLGSLQAMRPVPALTDLYLCNLTDAVAPDSKAPLTAMAANALQAVSTQLCNAHPR